MPDEFGTRPPKGFGPRSEAK